MILLVRLTKLMFLFINFFYWYWKSISIFDCYQIANVLITDIDYFFIDWLHLVFNFMYFNYFSQLCWYNWHQCHWGGRIIIFKTNIWSLLSNKTRKWEQLDPFVVDASVTHVPVHDDIKDNQEFYDMWV